MNFIRVYIMNKKRIIINLVFEYLLIFYLLFLLLENILNISMLKFINFNYLLIVVIILGIYIYISLNPTKKFKTISLSNKDIVLSSLLGIISALIINFKFKNFGLVSDILSIIVGIIIYLLNCLLVKNGNNK